MNDLVLFQVKCDLSKWKLIKVNEHDNYFEKREGNSRLKHEYKELIRLKMKNSSSLKRSHRRLKSRLIHVTINLENQ